MNQEYLIETEAFKGPLNKLLLLIEERKLEVTRLSLGAITSDFLLFIQKMEGSINSAILSDFLVVASKLILIKSKELIPSLELKSEEESEIKDLENRLMLYRKFSLRVNAGESFGPGAAYLIKKLIAKSRKSYSRDYLKGIWVKPVFIFPKSFDFNELLEKIKRLFQLFDIKIPEPQATVKKIIITLEGKISELVNLFNSKNSDTFQTLSKNRSKGEIIVLFLAILHLVRDRRVKFEQKEKFGDIILNKEE